MNILFQPANHYGFGHTSRLIAIASSIRRQQPNVQLAFILEGEGAHPLLDAASFPYLALPESSQFCDRGIWTKWTDCDPATIPFALAVAAMERLQPDVVVFDSFPYLSILRAAISFELPIVLCARQTRDDAVYYRHLSAYASALTLILLPHEPGTIDLPASLASRTRYVGTIVRDASQAANLPSTTFANEIIVTGGGGGIPRTVDFYNLALAGFARCRARHPDVSCVLIAGPLFREWQELHLIDGIHVIPFEPHLQVRMSSARLVICRGGYNTSAELSRTCVPCISIPATTTLDDQVKRATEMAACSPGFHVYLGNDAQILADLMDSCLRAPPLTVHHARIREDGADVAAAAILEVGALFGDAATC